MLFIKNQQDKQEKSVKDVNFLVKRIKRLLCKQFVNISCAYSVKYLLSLSLKN